MCHCPTVIQQGPDKSDPNPVVRRVWKFSSWVKRWTRRKKTSGGMHVKTQRFKILTLEGMHLKEPLWLWRYRNNVFCSHFEWVTKLKTIKTSIMLFLASLVFWFATLLYFLVIAAAREACLKKENIGLLFSLWSDYIIWLLNASLVEILELFWISTTGISFKGLGFEFENLWHEYKFYR